MARKGNKFIGPQPQDFEPTGINAYLGLGRPLELDNWLSRSALLAGILAAAGLALWRSHQGLDGSAATMAGIGLGLNMILSFLIGRELDPDRRAGSLIGSGLTLLAGLFLGEGNPLVLLWLLFILRMFTRSSGDRHRIADNVLIIAVAVYLGKEGYWLYPLTTGAFYALESQISEGYPRSLYLSAIALAGTALAEYNVLDNALSFSYLILLAVFFLLFLPELRLALYVHARGDKNNKRLNPRRLQVAQGSFILMAFVVILFQGNSQAQALLPALLAAIGCGLWLLVCLLRKQVDFTIEKR